MDVMSLTKEEKIERLNRLKRALNENTEYLERLYEKFCVEIVKMHYLECFLRKSFKS